MQYDLMRELFRDIPHNKLLVLKNDPSDFCSLFPGIECEAGIIRKISFSYNTLGNYRIADAPSVTRILSIGYAKQSYQLESRLFPRESLKVCFPGNEIFGTIELRTLPRNLQLLNLMGNRIVGPVYLTNLPESLVHLWIHGNQIQQDFILYTKTPSSLKHILIMGMDHRIQKFYRIEENGTCRTVTIEEASQDGIKY